MEIYLKCIKNSTKFKDFEITLHRDRHIAFLRRGLKQLSDAYEVSERKCKDFCLAYLSCRLLGLLKELNYQGQ